MKKWTGINLLRSVLHFIHKTTSQHSVYPSVHYLKHFKQVSPYDIQYEHT